MALSGFETVSRVLFGWLGRLLTKDSIGLKNQLVKARIPLLAQDYIATSVMMVLTSIIVGIGINLISSPVIANYPTTYLNKYRKRKYNNRNSNMDNI